MPPPPPSRSAPAQNGQSSYQVKPQKAVYSTVPPVSLLVSYFPDEAQRKQFIETMTEVQVKKDAVVMRQGDKGNNFYIVKSGCLEVNASGQAVRHLIAGTMCGELSIITGATRSATVTVSSDDAVLLMASKKMFVNGAAACRL